MYEDALFTACILLRLRLLSRASRLMHLDGEEGCHSHSQVQERVHMLQNPPAECWQTPQNPLPAEPLDG